MIQNSPPEAPAILAPITKKLVVDDVLSTLRKAILSSAYAAGDHLVESRLAQQLGVSRAPVREAMFQLEREGLIQFGAQGAALVKDMTSADMTEIFEMRRTLEVMAARLACTRLTPALIDQLKENIRKSEAEPSLLNVTLLDVAFHDLINLSAGNSRLRAAWLNLRPQIQFWLARVQAKHQATTHQTRAITQQSHTGLLNDLLSGDPERAARAMEVHMDGWLIFLESLSA